MHIPPIARQVSNRYMAAIDARHPGLLTGLYLVGSIALDDFHAGESDVDFVALTSRSVGLAEIAPVHADAFGTKGRPFFDGIYVTEEDLRTLPARSSRGVAVIDGTPLPNSTAERHAVTWLTLARYGVPVRGRIPATSWIAADLMAAQAHSRENLDGYWCGWIASHRAPPDLDSSAIEAMTWSVLGVSRLHALITEGLVLSKTGAGRYALAIFPHHRPIIESALAVRLGASTGFGGGLPARHKAMLAFLDDAIADAGRR